MILAQSLLDHHWTLLGAQSNDTTGGQISFKAISMICLFVHTVVVNTTGGTIRCSQFQVLKSLFTIKKPCLFGLDPAHCKNLWVVLIPFLSCVLAQPSTSFFLGVPLLPFHQCRKTQQQREIGRWRWAPPPAHASAEAPGSAGLMTSRSHSASSPKADFCLIVILTTSLEVLRCFFSPSALLWTSFPYKVQDKQFQYILF